MNSQRFHDGGRTYEPRIASSGAPTASRFKGMRSHPAQTSGVSYFVHDGQLVRCADGSPVEHETFKTARRAFLLACAEWNDRNGDFEACTVRELRTIIEAWAHDDPWAWAPLIL